ncbi:MAG: NosD domain-containing protein [Promethearchaeota archaeon]
MSQIVIKDLGQNIVVIGTATDYKYWSGFQEYVGWYDATNRAAYWDSDGAQYEILVNTPERAEVRFYDIEPRHHYSGGTTPLTFNWTISLSAEMKGFSLSRLYEASATTTDIPWEQFQGAFLPTYNNWYYNSSENGHGNFDITGTPQRLYNPKQEQICGLYSNDPTMCNITVYPDDMSRYDMLTLHKSLTSQFRRIEILEYHETISTGIYDLGTLYFDFGSTFIPHAPIVINGDSDFITQGWPGSGTISDPYRIENWLIDLHSTPGYCIAIYNTLAYFVVNNCITTGATNWGIPHILGGGLLLDNVENGCLKNNTCLTNGCGILLENSANNQLINNTCINNDWIGIRLKYSDNNQLIDNKALSNYYYGLSLDYSDFNSVINTVSNDNSQGIYLWGSCSNTITGATLINNMWSGVYFQYSGDNTLTQSTFTGCGLRITTDNIIDARQKQVTDNTVNGKPLVFIRDQVGGSVTGPAGQIVLVNCTEITVANYQLHDCSIGIDMVFTDYSTIENNIISDNIHCGIEIWLSIHNTVRNNTLLFDGSYGGIYGGVFINTRSTGNLITNNTCMGNRYGIHVSGSNSNKLINNTLLNNNYGIGLGLTSNYNFIRWNRFFDNAINAVDDGLGNEFDYNYWSDYTGTDENLDGIGDTPYDITGTTENQDPHPLMYSFGILAHRDIQLELSGSFDFIDKEDIRLQIAALLTDKETGEPISSATITAIIYDPDGNELLLIDFIEEVPGSGVYIYRSPLTLKDLKWLKGIYLVIATATVIDYDIIVGETTAMFQFHIDPPGETTANPPSILTWLLITVIILSTIGISIPLIHRLRKHNHQQPL